MTSKVTPQEFVRKAVGATSRRAQYSASTQRALVDVARALFSEKGYAATSLDEVVAGARVTKGALYHHFAGKQALFEAVFERVEDDAHKRIQKAIRTAKEPWAQVDAAVRAFLEIARGQEYRRVVLQDGPAVLGYERFREQEERTTFKLVQDLVAKILPSGAFPAELTDMFARLFFGAVSTAGSTVSTSDDPERATQALETVLGVFVAGLRQQLSAFTGDRPAQTG